MNARKKDVGCWCLVEYEDVLGVELIVEGDLDSKWVTVFNPRSGLSKVDRSQIISMYYGKLVVPSHHDLEIKGPVVLSERS